MLTRAITAKAQPQALHSVRKNWPDEESTKADCGLGKHEVELECTKVFRSATMKCQKSQGKDAACACQAQMRFCSDKLQKCVNRGNSR